jgi:hypothetical protein
MPVDTDSPDVVLAKRLLDQAALHGFQFDGSLRVRTRRW